MDRPGHGIGEERSQDGGRAPETRYGASRGRRAKCGNLPGLQEEGGTCASGAGAKTRGHDRPALELDQQGSSA